MFVTKTTALPFASIVAELGESLWQFHNVTEHTHMEKALCLWRALAPKMVVPGVVHSEGIGGTIYSMTQDFLNRLEKKITSGVMERSKGLLGNGSDVKTCIETLAKEMKLPQNTPDATKELLHTLRACTALRDEVLNEKEIGKDSDELNTLLPHFVKLQGLEHEFLKNVLPDKWEKISKFFLAFQSSLKVFLDSTRDFLEKPSTLVVKLRQRVFNQVKFTENILLEPGLLK